MPPFSTAKYYIHLKENVFICSVFCKKKIKLVVLERLSCCAVLDRSTIIDFWLKFLHYASSLNFIGDRKEAYKFEIRIRQSNFATAVHSKSKTIEHRTFCFARRKTFTHQL